MSIWLLNAFNVAMIAMNGSFAKRTENPHFEVFFFAAALYHAYLIGKLVQSERMSS